MSRTRTTLQRTSAVLGAAGLLALGTVGSASAETEVPEPATFTSAFTAMATPDMVVNADDEPTPGEPGATGTFTYRINSDTEVICYDITLNGVTPPYQSPAKTATHIHQAVAGESGPPRLAFPNPTDDGSGALTSVGCLQGPFTTGVMSDGQDTGAGFSLAQIEADPASFFTDTHTSTYVPGAVRGQLTAIPVGGVETGAGGTAGGQSSAALAGALGGAAVIAAAGTLVLRRRTAQQ